MLHSLDPYSRAFLRDYQMVGHHLIPQCMFLPHPNQLPDGPVIRTPGPRGQPTAYSDCA